MNTIILTISEVEKLLDVKELYADLLHGFKNYSKRNNPSGVRVRSSLKNENSSAIILFPGLIKSIPAFTIKNHENLYNGMLDLVDENDNYHQFHDLEMIYLFVHEKKDQDDEKNRSEKTKREYFRELLWTYNMFINEGTNFEFNSINLDIYTLLKSVNMRHIRKYQEWLKDVHYGKGGIPYSIATISRKTTILKLSFHSFMINNT